jgi:hypothetical protein
MGKFRKKPVVIEAMRFAGTKESACEILSWAGPRCGIEHRYTALPSAPEVLVIETLEGAMRAVPGDYVIRGVKGEFYPCKPDIFDATYEPTTEGE